MAYITTLSNFGDGKEDAVAWFCGILQEILKEYGESNEQKQKETSN